MQAGDLLARLRLRARARVALAGGLAALVAAATATAAVAPKPGRYRGKTSQDRFASLRVRDDGSVRYLDLRWTAKCDHGGYWGLDDTRWHDSGNGIEQSGDEFSDGGSYDEPPSQGYSSRVKANMRGHFTSATRAEGRFHIVVNAKRNGKHVDWCRVKGHWHARRKSG